MPLTHLTRLGPEPGVARGRRAYHRLVRLPGEAHLPRHELGGPPLPVLPDGDRASIDCVVHMTDLHVADVQSPARFEFLNRELGDPRFQALVPVQRPQEALTPHALDALVRTLGNGVVGPATGLPVHLALTGGDSIDNAQSNELEALVGLLDGGEVDLRSSGGGYEGVQSPEWPDDIFWVPDGAQGADIFHRDFGFPTHPGLLRRALRPFRAAGLPVPWLGCRGNHEAHCQGVGVVTASLARGMTGGWKPVALNPEFDRDRALASFTVAPERFFDGPCREVTAEPRRRPVTPADLWRAHLRSAATVEPSWLGPEGRADFVHDTPSVRFIVLDTVCPAGSADGCVVPSQLRWLEDRLGEANDRLAVIVSHHGTDTIRSGQVHEDGSPNVGGRKLLALLLSFDSVVLWLNGHTHTHAIRPRRLPGGGRGLWEVTTASLIDWPCQARLIELFMGDGVLGIASTMVDHDAPPLAGGAEAGAELAALHRELAANVPWAGIGSRLAGRPEDRNVVMSRPLSPRLERLMRAG